MVAFIKKQYAFLIAILFFLGTFFLSIRPLLDYDLWFDLKSGEIFSKLGIIHTDVFSYTEYGKTWFPYEWLFQIFVYFLYKATGLIGIQLFVALAVVMQLLILYFIFKKLLSLHTILVALLCFFFFACVYEFYVARPFIVAYIFLTLNLFIILKYFFTKRNFLWLTLPITLLWTNTHGSIFLDIFFFVAYAAIAAFLYMRSRKQEWLQKCKSLSVYSGITAVLTILPPLSLTQYTLLWKFYEQRTILTRFIAEWTPLSSDQLSFTLYTVTLLVVVGLFVFVVFKKKTYTNFLWTLPFFPLTISAYIASRNEYLGYLGLTILLGSIAKYLDKKIWIGLGIIIVLYGTVLLQQKLQPTYLYYPVNAASFVEKYRLKGNMFNEYAYGGYLLWRLYPEQKVFIDGRSDVYLDREMPEVLKISTNKNLSDKAFQSFMYKNFFDKYHMSFAILRTEKNSVLRKIGRILDTDPSWSLVMWDDTTEVYVRKDGKNDAIIKQFGTSFATPYLRDPYVADKQEQALSEYLKMNSLIPSAHSSNAIGFILLQKGQFEEARKRFLEAKTLDPSFESPYMNLAELSAKDGDLDNAISLYQEAKDLAPDRGLIYIRLGQLTLEKTQDLQEAKQIWEDGVKNTADADAKKQLELLLSR